MEVEKAIKILDPETSAELIYEMEYNCGFNHAETIKTVEDACVVAVKAMKKMIPMTPCSTEHGYVCPICDSFVEYKYTPPDGSYAFYCRDYYCSICGQKMDWSEIGLIAVDVSECGVL